MLKRRGMACSHSQNNDMTTCSPYPNARLPLKSRENPLDGKASWNGDGVDGLTFKKVRTGLDAATSIYQQGMAVRLVVVVCVTLLSWHFTGSAATKLIATDEFTPCKGACAGRCTIYCEHADAPGITLVWL